MSPDAGADVGLEAETTLPYLSDRWLAAANAAVRELEPLSVELRVGYRVTDCPPDEATIRSHTLVLGPEPVEIVAGLDEPNVTLTMTWRVAVEIAAGRVSAQRSFLDGHIQLAGRPDALLGHQARLSTVDDLLAAVRSRTTY